MIGGAGECFGAQIEAQWRGALVLRQARALSEQKTAEYYRGLIRIRIGFGGPLHYKSQKEPPKIVLGNYLAPCIKGSGFGPLPMLQSGCSAVSRTMESKTLVHRKASFEES